MLVIARSALIAMYLWLAASILRADPICGPQWLDNPSGVDAWVTCATTWDPDGDGPLPPVLVVGGYFSMAGSTPANHIAAWDGASWSALGTGMNEGVLALTVFTYVQALPPGMFVVQEDASHPRLVHATEPVYAPGSPIAARAESRADDKTPPGSDLGTIQEQVLVNGVDVAILNCLYAVDSLHNPDAAIALSRGVNDWLVAEWLARDERLRASIVVPSQLPAEAARAPAPREDRGPPARR